MAIYTFWLALPDEPEDGDLQWLEAAGFVAFDSFEPGLLFGVQKEISDDRALAEPDAFLRDFSEEKDGTLCHLGARRVLER